MSDTIHYTLEDIDEFIQITNEIENQESSKSLKKLLSVRDKISIFKNIDPIYLKAIVYDVKFVKVGFKDYIIKQGDNSEDIFFIIDGECQVFYNKKHVATLFAGEVFGESGVLFKHRRNASVICASKEATLLCFKVDEDNLEFGSKALVILYKNLALQINSKLEELNATLVNERLKLKKSK